MLSLRSRLRTSVSISRIICILQEINTFCEALNVLYHLTSRQHGRIALLGRS